MLTDLALVAAGLALLVFAGDALVRGAVALSLRLGVPALVVSLTVVAFGTSAPEMLVSVQATLDGATGLVFGNIVGSNIANILLIMGVPALISPIVVSQKGVMRNFVTMIGASLLLIAACFFLGGVFFWTGLFFLGLLAFMIFDAYRLGKAGRIEIELEEGDEHMRPVMVAACILGGVLFLPVGAHLLIEGARGAALAFGVSEAAIGLTLVADGTTLLELAITVMAAVRRQADVAVGNVVGSNIFNILAVFGVAALVGPLPTPAGFLELDLWIMLGSSLLLLPFIALRLPVARLAGLAFLTAYVVYCVLALGPRM